MELILVRAIDWFADILILLLMLRAIVSWVIPGTGMNSGAGRFYQFLLQLTEPFVAPIRKAMSGLDTGMFDFSVLVAFFVIRIVASILIRIIYMIF